MASRWWLFRQRRVGDVAHHAGAGAMVGRLPTLRLLSRRTPARVGRAGRQARPDFVISLKSGGWWWVSPTLRLLRLLRSLANFPKKDTMRSRVLRSGYV